MAVTFRGPASVMSLKKRTDFDIFRKLSSGFPNNRYSSDASAGSGETATTITVIKRLKVTASRVSTVPIHHVEAPASISRPDSLARVRCATSLGIRGCSSCRVAVGYDSPSQFSSE